MTGQRHLLYVLALAEAGLTVLASLGQFVSMGLNGLYLLWGAAVAALYVVAGLKGSRGRRWALIILITAESVRLVGVLLSVLLGLVPFLQATFTATSVVDSVLLPGAVLWLAVAILRYRPAAEPEPLNPTRALPTEAISPGWASAYVVGAYVGGTV
jgi:hypothetical protein